MNTQGILVAAIFTILLTRATVRSSTTDESDTGDNGVVSISDRPINSTNTFPATRAEQRDRPVVLAPRIVGVVDISDRPINPSNVFPGTNAVFRTPTLLTTRNGGTVRIVRRPINRLNPFPSAEAPSAQPPVVLREPPVPLSLSVADAGDNLVVTVQGGGVYQLEGKMNLNQTIWTPIGELTSDPKFVLPKSTGYQILRASAAASGEEN